MRRYDFPVGPLVLGVILMPLAEAQFRRALAISQGDLSIFVTRPLAFTILLLALAALVARLRGRRPVAERLVFGEGHED